MGLQCCAKQAPVDARRGLECCAEAGHDSSLMCGPRRPPPSADLPQRHHRNGRCQICYTGGQRLYSWNNVVRAMTIFGQPLFLLMLQSSQHLGFTEALFQNVILSFLRVIGFEGRPLFVQLDLTSLVRLEGTLERMGFCLCISYLRHRLPLIQHCECFSHLQRAD